MFQRSSGPILGNPSGVTMEPLYDSQRIPNDKVTLYFIGFKMMRKMEDGRLLPPVFNLNGVPFVAPPIGEGVIVDRVDAEHLIQVSKSGNPNPGGDAIDGFTTDPTIAKAVKQAYLADPDMKDFNFSTLVGLAGREGLKTVDDSAVLAEAAARLGISVEALKAVKGQSEVKQDAPPPADTVIDSPPTPTSTRNKNK
jgi:hypothetical protein